jgi:hypothetical protein
MLTSSTIHGEGVLQEAMLEHLSILNVGFCPLADTVGESPIQ